MATAPTTWLKYAACSNDMLVSRLKPSAGALRTHELQMLEEMTLQSAKSSRPRGILRLGGVRVAAIYFSAASTMATSSSAVPPLTPIPANT